MGDDIAKALRREGDAARGLLDALGDLDGETRHDTAEGETSLFEAIDAALDHLDDCTAIVAGCEAVARVYLERADKAKARMDRVRGLIEQAMLISGLPTVKRPLATLTVRDVKPKAMIADEATIPARFWRQPDPVLDKKAINAAVAAGEDVPGVTKDNGGTSLQIRRL
jgi:hypothetical protein